MAAIDGLLFDSMLSMIITLTAKGSTVLAEMQADFDRWSKRLVKALGKENVTQTIEDLHELKRVLDADAEHFDADPRIEGPAPDRSKLR